MIHFETQCRLQNSSGYVNRLNGDDPFISRRNLVSFCRVLLEFTRVLSIPHIFINAEYFVHIGFQDW